jgi:hypothetical protein
MEIKQWMESDYDYKELMVYGPSPEEVADVVRWYDGEGDYEDWLVVLRMTDGRWCFVSAGCDYTGWDCRAGGDHWFASSEDELVETVITQSQRRMLGYEETPTELL